MTRNKHIIKHFLTRNEKEVVDETMVKFKKNRKDQDCFVFLLQLPLHEVVDNIMVCL